MSQYSVHKLWFYYNDEWYETDNELGPCLGVFDTYDEALKAKAQADRQSLRKISSYDWLSDLANFIDNSIYESTFETQLLAYARAQNWHEFIIEHNNNGRVYYDLNPPKDATEDQLDQVLAIANASFHRIVEYKDVKECGYIKLNYDFWGEKVFDKLKADGVLENRSTPDKGFYLIYKPLKGRKSAKFPAYDMALDFGLECTYNCIQEFEEFNYLGKTYLEDAVSNFTMLKAYLNNCQTIALKEEVISAENLKSIQSCLKKMKSTAQKSVGDSFFSLSFDQGKELNKKELSGLIELLKVKPYNMYRVVQEINGEEIKAYVSEAGLF